MGLTKGMVGCDSLQRVARLHISQWSSMELGCWTRCPATELNRVALGKRSTLSRLVWRARPPLGSDRAKHWKTWCVHWRHICPGESHWVKDLMKATVGCDLL